MRKYFHYEVLKKLRSSHQTPIVREHRTNRSTHSDRTEHRPGRNVATGPNTDQVATLRPVHTDQVGTLRPVHARTRSQRCDWSARIRPQRCDRSTHKPGRNITTSPHESGRNVATGPRTDQVTIQ
ncbi:hypothetical protein F2Q70_00029548 [Brassica cretica]|uniref:Uncharacterized protein n=1 Tax=Brassica cretica TaxID=69181 RepID=A0A8S9FEW9_BRACR|nr:hypothetical protein F2Q70_00029548 [Brassica cretica]KAF2549842.1 hypothetical protein F2Q68_00033952 [Brassica cretica]KAF3489307.1 hypothetical protein F2Q69_00052706 [Brassica cretica]